MNKGNGIVRGIGLLLIVSLFVGTGVVYAQSGGLAIGAQLPLTNQALENIEGGQLTLADIEGTSGTVVIFWSNECPWVERYEGRILDLAGEFEAKGFGFILVNANDPRAFPGENLEASRERAQASNYTIPYVLDSGSTLAKAFGATRTPHVFVFDADDKLVYMGTVDDSPGDPRNVKEHYLRDALNAVLEGQPIASAETKAFGCNIKFQ